MYVDVGCGGGGGGGDVVVVVVLLFSCCCCCMLLLYAVVAAHCHFSVLFSCRVDGVLQVLLAVSSHQPA